MPRYLELSIAVVIGVIIGGLVFIIASPPRGKPIDLVTLEDTSEITVYVTGAVNQSGLYNLPVGSRLLDAINKAGSFSTDADETSINLADVLSDGQKLIIPRIGDPSNLPATLVENSECNLPSTSLDTIKTPININSASSEELDRLPGIGPAKAKDIISYRHTNGGFQKIEELLLVPGIGSVLFDGMKDFVTVE